MKTLTALSSIILLTALHTPVSQAASTELKQELSFGGSAIAGAILAGPVGYVVGAISGAYMAEQIKKADELEQQLSLSEDELALLEARVELGESMLNMASSEVDDLQYKLRLQAEAPVFFGTGSDKLSTQAVKKLSATVRYLQEEPTLKVHLAAYADPRGTEGYNQILSEYRAMSVKQSLMEQGINEDRISYQGHGINHQVDSDINSYELERRVDIHFVGQGNDEFVMNK